MRRILAIIAIIISVPLLTLGLLFLLAAGDASGSAGTRLLAAGAFVAFGLLPLAWGIVTLRRQAATSPEALATSAIALARRLGGEVTAAQVQAEFHIAEALAQDTLDKLCAAGQAEAQMREGRTVYVIRGLQQPLVVRRCPYCGSRFPAREARSQCPNCGASLELQKT
ncbi:MAG TPA: hypothetical protein PLJ35_11745 [Anaerolineae bacterium]|nr:hypothetical protein [Anaerolineae bacterium]HPL27787.1 hypothetical protein [Anaerolineae bacterium]HPL27792.1 hypothetical protein [Anaerolineae bacterium]